MNTAFSIPVSLSSVLMRDNQAYWQVRTGTVVKTRVWHSAVHAVARCSARSGTRDVQWCHEPPWGTSKATDEANTNSNLDLKVRVQSSLRFQS